MTIVAGTDATALFAPAGPGHWTATELARGPWDPNYCHGGPVAALLTRAVEIAGRGDEVDWQIARATIELTRPVPVNRPLQLTTEIERPGRRVSLIAARLTDDGNEVARVRALRIRRTTLALPVDTATPPDQPPADPRSGRVEKANWAAGDAVAFHKDATEHRFTESSWDVPGPVGVWIRLLVPVVEGEIPSGVQRAVAAADFGNGLSGALTFEEYIYINPDLTVHLFRAPVGEWIGLRSASYYGLETESTGAGLAESALYDTHGRVGRSVQSLVVDVR